jgi:hypothetical protein
VVPAPVPAPAGGGGDGRARTGPPEFGFFCAFPPGAFVFGTTPQAVTQTVRRYKGRGGDDSLARSANYRAAAAGRHLPDLFVYVDAPRVAQWAEIAFQQAWQDRRAQVLEANRARRKAAPAPDPAKEAEQLARDLEQAERHLRGEFGPWMVARTLLNPAGMRFLTTSWELQGGNFTWRLEVHMKPGQLSPVLSLLEDQTLGEDLLRGVPRDSYFVMALPLADGAATWKGLLTLAEDCYCEAGGEAPVRDKFRRDLERRLRQGTGREVWAPLRGLAWAVRLGPPGKEGLPVGPEQVSPGVLLAAARDERGGRDLETVLPKVLAPGTTARIVHVAGQVVHSVEGDVEQAAGNVPAFFGRRGKTVILGWRRIDVARALADFAAPPDLRDHPHSLPVLRRQGPVAATALFSGRQALSSVARALSCAPEQSEKDLRILQGVRELAGPMALMQPTLLTVHRRPDGVSAELRQADLRAAAGTVNAVLLSWMVAQ